MPRRIYLPKDNHKTFVARLNADRVLVPKWFVRKWPHAFEPNAKLQDPAKRIHVAHVARNDLIHRALIFLDCVKFSNQQVSIRFQYIRNNFFKIRMYDLNEVEINCPTSYRVARGGVNDHVHDDQPQPTHLDNPRPPILWGTQLSAASASGKQGLVIPANILINNFTDRPDALQVIVPDGPAQSWNLLWEKNRCVFGKGWYQYCRSAPFVPGDYLWFRVAQPHQNTLILTINDVY